MLALTSPTSGGRLVGIVRWRTKARELLVCYYYELTEARGPEGMQNMQKVLYFSFFKIKEVLNLTLNESMAALQLRRLAAGFPP
jgi:hypothetical protein